MEPSSHLYAIPETVDTGYHLKSSPPIHPFKINKEISYYGDMGLIAGPQKGVLLKCAAPVRKSGVQGTQTDYYLTKQVFMEAIRAHVRPREATRLLFTQMCGLKFANCTHNGRDPKYQTYPLVGRCPPKSTPIMAIQRGCFDCGFEMLILLMYPS